MQALDDLVSKCGVDKTYIKQQASDDARHHVIESDDEWKSDKARTQANRKRKRTKLMIKVVKPLRKVVNGVECLYVRKKADGTIDLVRCQLRITALVHLCALLLA